MKASVKFTIKLKLCRSNIIGKTFIVFAEFGIYYKVKNVKVRENIHKIQVSTYYGDDILCVIEVKCLCYDVRNELKGFVNDRWQENSPCT